jgi:hypothetical protein
MLPMVGGGLLPTMARVPGSEKTRNESKKTIAGKARLNAATWAAISLE